MAEDKSKVLVVEDEQTLVDTLEYSLRRQGYEVYTATDGRAALEAAALHVPDLVVLDVMLPGLDGFEVCRILRQDTRAPILMLRSSARTPRRPSTGRRVRATSRRCRRSSRQEPTSTPPGR